MSTYNFLNEDYCMFLDESGDHSLSLQNPDFPVFCLAGIVVKMSDYAIQVEQPIDDFKTRWLRTTFATLHSTDIRKRKRVFAFLADTSLRSNFMNDLDQLIERTPIIVIACCINKRQLVEQSLFPANPYDMSLEFVMHQFHTFLRQRRSTGYLIVESRGRKEDNNLIGTFGRIKHYGTIYSRRPTSLSAITSISFQTKKDYVAGLDLADLIAYPIARKLAQPDQLYLPFTIVEKKLYRRSGVYEGYGLQVLP